MTDNVIRLPYTSEELKSILAKVSNLDQFLGNNMWTCLTRSLLNSKSCAPKTWIEVDLSEYLPKDEFNYEVKFNIWYPHNSNTSQEVAFIAKSNVEGSQWITETFHHNQHATFTLNIGTDRKMYIRQDRDWSATLGELLAYEYRRLGKSVTEVDSINTQAQS